MRRYSEAVNPDMRGRMSLPHRQSVAQNSKELSIHVATLFKWRQAWRLQRDGFELQDDLLGCVPCAFHGGVPGPVWPDDNSHSPGGGPGSTSPANGRIHSDLLPLAHHCPPPKSPCSWLVLGDSESSGGKRFCTGHWATYHFYC
jgi:hypothetical protein